MSSSSSSSSSSSYSSSEHQNDRDQVEVPCQAQDDIGNNIINDSATPSMETPSQSLSTIPGSTVFDNSASTSKRRRIDSVALALPCFEDKRLLNDSSPMRLQKRINWRQEDELRLLQSFLDYTKNWKCTDIALFYDQEVEPELKLRFNKSQLVDKLRRLKRKYHEALSKKNSTGIEFCFKTPHDKATFEISHRIWRSTGSNVGRVGLEDVNNGVDDNETTLNLKDIRVKREEDAMDDSSGDRMMRRPQTWSQGLRRKRVVEDDSGSSKNRDTAAGLILELALSPIPLSDLEMKYGGEDHEKWKKQQILELEVYSKRLELVQEQVKSALEELRSMGGSS
ncbi:hypothetical protein FNV43_RR04804 [Rhamnella rubrinervis]|uniref:Glabrous enhancer-binding protein-like DBD domain-containing protein n=1 Tax=Rhamnella rubrinervis TaxID=2594499 RepID=A0A8K0MQ41_9ROSA|nr:hypothetical protein FNV43_RR04804 [Rhamnella rubrinervis]